MQNCPIFAAKAPIKAIGATAKLAAIPAITNEKRPFCRRNGAESRRNNNDKGDFMENNMQPHEERSSPTYNLDIEALNNLISFARANNPRFKDMSEAKMAEACDVSVTTFKDIRKGRCRKPRVDILYSIVSALGGSIDRLVGLAPTRDIAKESAVWDATLVEGYQQRIDTLTAQVESLMQQLSAKNAETERLHAAVLEERTERATAAAVCSQHINTIGMQGKTIKYQRYILLGMLGVWLLFEILNPSFGVSGWIARLFS